LLIKTPTTSAESLGAAGTLVGALAPVSEGEAGLTIASVASDASDALRGWAVVWLASDGCT
jgi:hypothetical protein